ncbi:MAG: hypothetical protein KJ697_03395 [Nanoarchaeota archaeon]|nr:hypothetical protein [Nanoarchaeota archaeon]MBU4124178.1 hypothetical protein [Nanoarchaeota archaeon]
MDEISKIIEKRGIKPADCAYHTLRDFENGGRLRALLIKGETITHVEYKCPECGHVAYTTQPWVPVSKAASVRFIVECVKCKFKIKVEKLKGKKKKAKKE